MKNDNLEDKAKNEDESKRQPQIYWWPKKNEDNPINEDDPKNEGSPQNEDNPKN